jgi:hypothetical protein
MKHAYAWAALLALATTSCAVYAPLAPVTPLVQEAGELEVQAGVHTPSALTASVSYSPVRHLLLTATGAANFNGGDTTYFRYQHAEVAAGYYTVFSQRRSYLGVLAGYGRTHSRRGYEDFGSGLLGGSYNGLARYDARYNRYFGQVYLAAPGPKTTFGGSLRATALDFSRLTRNGEAVHQEGKF